MFIKFLNGKKYLNVQVFSVNPTTMEVIGAGLNEGGFNIYLDNGVKIGNYEDYKYLKEQVAIRDYRYTNIAP